MRPIQLFVLLLLVMLPIASVLVQNGPGAPSTADAISAADLATVPAGYVPPLGPDETTGSDGAPPSPAPPDPAIVKLRVLSDWAGTAPKALAGFTGEHLRDDIAAF